MQRLMAWEKRLDRILETLVTLMFFSILSLTILLVVMRYGFNSSIIGGNEAMGYLFIYTTALGAAVSVGKGDHIRISFLVDYLEGFPRRCIDIFGYLLIAFINAVMIYYSLPWIRSAGYFESPVMRIPNWMVQVSVPIGCALVIIYCLNHVVLEWTGRHTEPKDAS
ncbi:MAG: TRAP transporter small permease [Deltaproteobacteria bacterium]|nr:TRAP transporter small permease [Deltaproteobacteria bacterium]